MSRNPPYTREISELLDVQSAYYKMLCEKVKRLAQSFMQIIAPIAAKQDEAENDH